VALQTKRSGQRMVTEIALIVRPVIVTITNLKEINPTTRS
tara:strand:+ start:6812 stop:6931 length:120 start_codon:yes stop_codon:yes gene_type:complete